MTFDLRAWQARHGFTYDTAAAALGIERTTFYRYLGKPVLPLWLLRACRDIDGERDGKHGPIALHAAYSQKKPASFADGG